MLFFIVGMNVNVRELHQHVEYEPDHYYASFSAELEICSSTMWCVLKHCTEPVRNTVISRTRVPDNN